MRHIESSLLEAIHLFPAAHFFDKKCHEKGKYLIYYVVVAFLLLVDYNFFALVKMNNFYHLCIYYNIYIYQIK